MRTTVTVFARGLLDLVPEADILAYADPGDRNHDGISGRPNRSVDGRLGRFGRKAFVPTLAEFNAGAFVAEMGITNPAEPTEENIGGQPIPPGVDPVPDPEIEQAALDSTDDFVRFLGRPSPARLGRKGRRGRKLFAEIGCAACHVPTLRTGPSPIHALDRREFPAYTDLLLHDMGPDLADICLGRATPSEFRTEPLIDLRHAKSFLHDGRASTLEEAIAAHRGDVGQRDACPAVQPARVRDPHRPRLPAARAALRAARPRTLRHGGGDGDMGVDRHLLSPRAQAPLMQHLNVSDFSRAGRRGILRRGIDG